VSAALPPVRLGNVILDPESREVVASPAATGAGVAGAGTGAHCTVLQLGPGDFRLLYLLAANPGVVIPTQRLAAYAGVTRVRQHVSRLRARLDLAECGSGAVVAHRGVGYAYVPDHIT
jgi:DNA-binding response OmpR family regulator